MTIELRYNALRAAYDPHEVGHRIRILRQVAEMSQSSLASHLGTKPNTISQFEGGVARPSADIELRLKAAFGVTIDWIRFGEMSGTNPDLVRRIEEAARSVPLRKSVLETRSRPKKEKALTTRKRRSPGKESG